MQTNITDFNIKKSIYNLDRQRLFSNIYENIHGLACLLECVDNLILSNEAKIQAKKLKNKPQCKLWKSYEKHLSSHIVEAYDRWYEEFADKERTEYNETINYKNMKILFEKLNTWVFPDFYPDWVTDEVIQIHKSHLIQKEMNNEEKVYFQIINLINKQYELNLNIEKECKKSNLINKKIDYLFKLKFHYRTLCPECPRDLKMRYDWRESKI